MEEELRHVDQMDKHCVVTFCLETSRHNHSSKTSDGQQLVDWDWAILAGTCYYLHPIR